jgi:hypothetical protein
MDADTFKQIAQPLRRALRLIADQPAKPSHAEQDADLLLNTMRAGGNNAGEPGYEVGCVLDEFLNAANRVYAHRHIFTLMYLDALKDEDRDGFEALAFARVKAILRQLKKGVTPAEIARQLKEGSLR